MSAPHNATNAKDYLTEPRRWFRFVSGRLYHAVDESAQSGVNPNWLVARPMCGRSGEAVANLAYAIRPVSYPPCSRCVAALSAQTGSGSDG